MDETAVEVDRIIDALPPEQREHLKTLVYNLVTAFDPEQDHRQVLMVFYDGKKEVIKIGTANMTEEEAAGLLMHMAEAAKAQAMHDAPPKEMFN